MRGESCSGISSWEGAASSIFTSATFAIKPSAVGAVYDRPQCRNRDIAGGHRPPLQLLIGTLPANTLRHLRVNGSGCHQIFDVEIKPSGFIFLPRAAKGQGRYAGSIENVVVAPHADDLVGRFGRRILTRDLLVATPHCFRQAVNFLSFDTVAGQEHL